MNFDQIFEESCRCDLIDFSVQLSRQEFSSRKLPDRYVAMSLLQKAIRRNRADLAWQAGSYLLAEIPTALWTRLAIVALEDVGIADIPAVMKTLLACSNAKLRDEMGGSVAAAYSVVELLCGARKDRATDDLYDVLSRDPEIAEQRACLADLEPAFPKNQLYPPVGGVVEAALALCQVAGSLETLDEYVQRKSAWADVISTLPEEAVSPCIKAVAQLGLRKTGLILAPILCALTPFKPIEHQQFEDDCLPERLEAGIPSWALGMHTRVGLSGFRLYLSRSARMNALLKHAATGEVSRSRVIGGLVFRLDDGQLVNRLDWDIGKDLKARATDLRWGISDEAVPEALLILREEWDLLNECRCAALRNYLR